MFRTALSVIAVVALGLAAALPASADKSAPRLPQPAVKGKAAVGRAGPRLTARAPDLIPIVKSPFNGLVVVRNIGSAPAGPSVVTVKCTKLGGIGGCAEHPGMAAYQHPAYPNKVAVKVPPLAAGKGYRHRLKFWGKLRWRRGIYRFAVIADDGNKVAETNEFNNKTTTVLNVP